MANTINATYAQCTLGGLGVIPSSISVWPFCILIDCIFYQPRINSVKLGNWVQTMIPFELFQYLSFYKNVLSEFKHLLCVVLIAHFRKLSLSVRLECCRCLEWKTSDGLIINYGSQVKSLTKRSAEIPIVYCKTNQSVTRIANTDLFTSLLSSSWVAVSFWRPVAVVAGVVPHWRHFPLRRVYPAGMRAWDCRVF